MKLLHSSDLHLGKVLHGFSLLEDQAYILKQIVEIAREEEVDGILLAGDIYDRSVPPSEAVGVFDEFFGELVGLPKKPAVFIIYGNHDGGQRLSFASKALQEARVYISPVYRDDVKPIVMEDEFGEVHFYLLPFIHPVQMQEVVGYEEGAEVVDSYEKAVAYGIRKMGVNPEARNVCMTHQYVGGGAMKYESQLSDSEHLQKGQKGGTDLVDVSLFADFDYVALGHLHSPQTIAGTNVRYSGSPMRYSASELGQEKSVTLVEIGAKGEVEITTSALKPKREVRLEKGTLVELQEKAQEVEGEVEDYVYVELTEEKAESFVAEKLRKIYPRMLQYRYLNLEREAMDVGILGEEEKSFEEMFADFFAMQESVEEERAEMSVEQRDFMNGLMEEIWRGE